MACVARPRPGLPGDSLLRIVALESPGVGWAHCARSRSIEGDDRVQGAHSLPGQGGHAGVAAGPAAETVDQPVEAASVDQPVEATVSFFDLIHLRPRSRACGVSAVT